MPDASRQAQQHWTNTPLFVSERDRYGMYPWLYQVAEFEQHAGERVLEIGCGTGSDLLQFAKHGAIATGVDITAKHLEMARQRVGSRATVMKADGRKLPFPDASFDYVYSHGVVHHSDEPQRIAQEIVRVLRPGGGFNVQVYALFSWVTFLHIAHHGRQWKLHVENSLEPVHIDLYTGRMLRRMFAPYRMTIRKYQWRASQADHPLSRYLGWYLIARGIKS